MSTSAPALPAFYHNSDCGATPDLQILAYHNDSRRRSIKRAMQYASSTTLGTARSAAPAGSIVAAFVTTYRIQPIRGGKKDSNRLLGSRLPLRLPALSIVLACGSPAPLSNDLHSFLDLGQDSGVIYGGRNAVTLPVGDSAHGAGQDLARSGLGQTVHESHYISKVSFRAATASSRRA